MLHCINAVTSSQHYTPLHNTDMPMVLWSSISYCDEKAWKWIMSLCNINYRQHSSRFLNELLARFLVPAVIWRFLCGNSHIVFHTGIIKLLLTFLLPFFFFILVQNIYFCVMYCTSLALFFKNYSFLTGCALFFDILVRPNAIPYLIYYESILRKNDMEICWKISSIACNLERLRDWKAEVSRRQC